MMVLLQQSSSVRIACAFALCSVQFREFMKYRSAFAALTLGAAART
jgi:hypothetical protein